MNSSSSTTACVIGAGPYGPAIAAHLQFIGAPMYRWIYQMPKHMFLKSEGCASSLPDPAGHYTLARYCGNEGLSFSDYSTPQFRVRCLPDTQSHFNKR